MTGYGRGEASRDGIKVSAELSSVNRKQGELAIYLPREMESLEPRVRTELNKRVARGRVTAKVTLHAADALPGQVQVNAGVARAYVNELRRLARDLKVSEDLSLEALVRLPGVLAATDQTDGELLWPLVEKAMATATDALVKMREKEGAHLAKDLNGRIKRSTGTRCANGSRTLACRCPPKRTRGS
jgi:uncharacterized protein (TIGR00255 family)